MPADEETPEEAAATQERGPADPAAEASDLGDAVNIDLGAPADRQENIIEADPDSGQLASVPEASEEVQLSNARHREDEVFSGQETITDDPLDMGDAPPG